jgi:hypothetical protein
VLKSLVVKLFLLDNFISTKDVLLTVFQCNLRHMIRIDITTCAARPGAVRPCSPPPVHRIAPLSELAVALVAAPTQSGGVWLHRYCGFAVDVAVDI